MNPIWRPEQFELGTALVRKGDHWLWFERLGERREAHTPAEVPALLDWMEEGFGVGWVAYEAAPGFDDALTVHPSDGPLAVVARAAAPILYRELASPGPNQAGPAWREAITAAEHRGAVQTILGDIAAGRVYQVNLTFPLVAEAQTSLRELAELFCMWCEADPPPFAALMALGSAVILSLSPELFFHRIGDSITTRPMKGTRPPAQAEELGSSAKDRAENLMIVDMIRNDLGRIATPGSVLVTDLFSVAVYPTVAQMTSTIQASIPNRSLSEVFGALFPCASVVGAPKIEATRAIFELEHGPRGAYCGAIGFTLPGGEAQFSVGIRTATIRQGAWRYGVGSGIVLESDPDQEWAECGWKARALQANTDDFELLETMLWSPGMGVSDLEAHLSRMTVSAAALGFTFDPDQTRRDLAHLEASHAQRVRLLCRRDGAVTLEHAPLVAWPVVIKGDLCPYPVDSNSTWLRHKTTHRALYEGARASRPDADEVLLWNERGELCEWTTGNLVLQIGQALYTPPLESGCLPGIARQRFLQEGKISERLLFVTDFHRASAVWHINSVRGWTRVQTAANLLA